MQHEKKRKTIEKELIHFKFKYVRLHNVLTYFNKFGIPVSHIEKHEQSCCFLFPFLHFV